MAAVRENYRSRSIVRTHPCCSVLHSAAAGTAAPQRRRGAVLIVILVCFVVAAAMFVLLGRQSVAQRREAETQLWTAQAQWIAEAALGAGRRPTDGRRELRGRNLDHFGRRAWREETAPRRRIHVENVADRPNRRLVRVEADYPDDPVHRSRWTKQITIDLKTPADEEGRQEAVKQSKSENAMRRILGCKSEIENVRPCRSDDRRVTRRVNGRFALSPLPLPSPHGFTLWNCWW